MTKTPEETEREYEAGIERLVADAMEAHAKAAGSGFREMAAELLASGFPVYGSHDDLPDELHPGEIIKLYPDGRREIVDFDREGNELLVRRL